eukprot:183676_1
MGSLLSSTDSSSLLSSTDSSSELSDDPYALIIAYWIRYSKIDQKYDTFPTEIDSIIIKYAEVIGIHDHNKKKQMIAIRKWNRHWKEYELKRDKILKEWKSSKHSTWKCSGKTCDCNTINNTKKTMRENDNRGIVLRCSNWLKCSGEKILIKKLTKEEVLGKPFRVSKCCDNGCGCRLYEPVSGITCKCSHLGSYHGSQQLYADEFDGEQSRPNELNIQDIQQIKMQQM